MKNLGNEVDDQDLSTKVADPKALRGGQVKKLAFFTLIISERYILRVNNFLNFIIQDIKRGKVAFDEL